MPSVKDPLDTPVMRQYLDLKAAYPDHILFFRMGDFYEMFLEDAETAAPLMDVALTKRQSEIPMAGVPYHSADLYLSRLLSAGKKVAIAEQTADPENPKLMSRSVVRLLSPGTIIEENLLTSGQNYLMAVFLSGNHAGIAVCDVSTGEFKAFDAMTDPAPGQNIPVMRDLTARFNPDEILCSNTQLDELKTLLPGYLPGITPIEAYRASVSEGKRKIKSIYKSDLKGLGFEEHSLSLAAVSMILYYIEYAFPQSSVKPQAPVLQNESDRLILDEKTITNLELFSKESKTTLFETLKQTVTAAGTRNLKQLLLCPMRKHKDIETQLNRVEFFIKNKEQRDKITEILKETSDLERTISRAETNRVRPQELRNPVDTAAAALKIQAILKKADPDGIFTPLTGLLSASGELSRLIEELDSVLNNELPAVLGQSSVRFLKPGTDAEYDEAANARSEGAGWIIQFESSERERTGLSGLKVKYNKVAGYFIEIPRAQAKQAPPDYERKQTLVNAERFTCTALKELEVKILSAEDIIKEIENRYYAELCKKLAGQRTAVAVLMNAIAHIDTVLALASCAAEHNWTRPVLTKDRTTSIQAGRHPVVERFLKAGETFVPNDTELTGKNRFAILTGPNMAGKSTYIRQTALLQILAQTGSFVPADSMATTPADRIFTRIGASDDLSRGESTFYVEMLETALILNQHTEDSFIIMDEVGRGTSTYDGLAIAGAVTEYITSFENPARTLFATHYHELTTMEENHPAVFNLTMDVQESEAGGVVFLRKVRPGAADRSYGIHVARLAGLPREVIESAEIRLKELERIRDKPESQNTEKKSARKRTRPDSNPTPDLFSGQ